MPVGCLTYRGRDDHSSCVDSLPHIAPVHSSRYLFDQNWSQSLGSERLVHTQEVDLSLMKLLAVYIEVDRDTRYKAKKFVFLASSDAE